MAIFIPRRLVILQLHQMSQICRARVVLFHHLLTGPNFRIGGRK